MRGLAACLVGLVGLGALATMAACSDSTDAGSGGAGGSPAVAGSGGKASSAGSSGKAGSGADECGFNSIECSGCLQEKCGDEATACSDVDDCAAALYKLANACVCEPGADAAKCISDFVSENGDPAKDLATCFNANCASVCN